MDHSVTQHSQEVVPDCSGKELTTKTLKTKILRRERKETKRKGC
jgi:hypothetical protein